MPAPNRTRALKKETQCAKGESKHQSALDLNNLPLCTLGMTGAYWNYWCSHLRDDIPCRGHVNAIASAASKA